MESVRMDPKMYEAAKSGKFHDLSTRSLENGEDIFHQTTPKGNNVLHVAAQYQQVNFIQDFLEDPSRSSLLWRGNDEGNTPLHVATQVGNLKMVQIFTERAKALHQPDAYKELLRKPNSYKNTLLHSAIRGGCKEVVELLIKEDPQLCDITNAAYESPLYHAVHRRFSDIIEPILCATLSPSSHMGPKGLTALHAAVHFKLPGLSEILKRRPYLIKEVDDIGWTPLHYAACFGNVEAVKLLLQLDPSVAYNLDENKESALHIAAFQGHFQVFDELVTSCPDACDMINTKRQTALHVAVTGGQRKVVKRILQMANLKDLINEQDIDGNTALHLAVLFKEYRIVYVLARDMRVDRFAINKDHLTALDIFFARGEVNLTIALVYKELHGSYGFSVIQDWVKKNVKERLDRQLFEGQPVGSMTIRSNIANRENFDSSIKSIFDAQLLVAAFIATVTFTAAFTIPGGYRNDGPNQGMAALAHKAAFQAFVIFNTIAFSFSSLVLFVQYDIYFLSDRQKVRFAGAAGGTMCIAMLGMMLAFASGTYVVLTKTIGLGIIPYMLIGGVVAWYLTSAIRYPKIPLEEFRACSPGEVRNLRRHYGMH